MDPEQIAEAVRAACIAAAADAFEDAGLQGLCAEGRWEVAVAAMRRLDLAPIIADSADRPSSAAGRDRAG